jgi:hypothetical protein
MQIRGMFGIRGGQTVTLGIEKEDIPIAMSYRKVNQLRIYPPAAESA